MGSAVDSTAGIYRVRQKHLFVMICVLDLREARCARSIVACLCKKSIERVEGEEELLAQTSIGMYTGHNPQELIIRSLSRGALSLTLAINRTPDGGVRQQDR